MPRLLILVLALAACHDKDSPAPAPSVASPATGSSGSASASAQSPRPTLAPVDGPDSRALPPEQAFAAEKEDPEWAVATEKTLRAKLPKLPDAKIACRQYHCAITMSGDENALARDVDQLQALQATGATLVMTRPNESAVVAYLRFDRE